MKAVVGCIGILIVLVIGHFIYSSQIRPAANGRSATEQVKYVSVRKDLLSLAQSERLYFATNGNYATLEQLQKSNIMHLMPKSNRSGFRYDIETDGAVHFRITASPTDSSSTDLPTLSVDETMQISE
jgi:hypothetical protein